MIKRALISVYDKTGLHHFADCLVDLCGDIEIISSGGTAKFLRECGSMVSKRVVDVSTYTGFPESPDGLLKTLQPKIHGGILLNPNIPSHREYMDKQGIKPIDLVVVNLYPFEETVAKPNITLDKAVEQIDIGGPTIERAAGKASLLHGIVTVVIDPKDYTTVIDELVKHRDVTPETKMKLARKVFERTSEYDKAIRTYLSGISTSKLDNFLSEEEEKLMDMHGKSL